MKTKTEIEKYISGCGQYLREKALRDRLGNRPSIDSLTDHPDKAACFYDYDGFASELESIERDLEAADKRLQRLMGHFALGRMEPFGNQSKRIDTAHEATSNAWAQVRCATIELRAEHPAGTRGLSLEQSAVRLAAAIFPRGDRRVRSVSRCIMEAAGLETVTAAGDLKPSNAAISLWLKELREEDARREKWLEEIEASPNAK